MLKKTFYNSFLYRTFPAPVTNTSIGMSYDWGEWWPRGETKEKLELDAWMKVLAPSTKLRKWFSHESERWPEFKKRHFRELKDNREQVSELLESADKKSILLLYGAKNDVHNQAAALKEWIEKHASKKRARQIAEARISVIVSPDSCGYVALRITKNSKDHTVDRVIHHDLTSKPAGGDGVGKMTERRLFV